MYLLYILYIFIYIYIQFFHQDWLQLSEKEEDHIEHKTIKIDSVNQKLRPWASLVAQWLRICLLMQETRVWALVWEDPTRRKAAGPVSHNYWACASGACAPQQERPR